MVRFVLLAAGAAVLWAALSPAWPALESVTAAMVARLARLIGTGAGSAGSTLVVWSAPDRPFSFVVTDGCTGLSLVLIYGVAVLAYPATRRQWLVGLACGSIALLAVNTLRLTSLAWIGAHVPSYFEPAHEIWWQGIGAAAVCLGWFLWLRRGVLRAVLIPLPRSRFAAARLQVARTVIKSRLSVTVVVFLTAFSALAIAGAMGGILVYGRVVSPLRWVVSTVMLHAGSILPRLTDQQVVSVFSLSYALVIGGAALLCALPAVPRRTRLVGTLAVYLPLAILLDAIGLGIFDAVGALVGQPHGFSLGGALLSALNSAQMALHLVIPLVLWRSWSRQAAELLEPSGSRNRIRREGWSE